jgi:hypothetical protein
MRALITILLLALVSGCGTAPRRFALQDPLWQDPDRNSLEHTPDERFIGNWADAADKTAFRPLSQLFYFPLPGESVNVNSLDEVPNSSWFTNRIGLFDMTPEEVAWGNCEIARPDPERGPWLVTRAKTQGMNPGFFVKMPNGKTYLLKFDGSTKPTRATAADVIGSKIYHAVGYNAPCNDIVYFRREILKIAEDAVAVDEVGDKRPLTEEDVEKVLAAAFRRKNGEIRAAASLFLSGKPLGPFENVGTRGDDPNDVIPHEDRREIRANRLLAAWLNHFDSRSANSLDMLAEENGRKFVKHYMIDFGDCFGGGASDPALGRLIGHAHYFDPGYIFLDFISLGLIHRPWEDAEVNPGAEIFGYYQWENFTPSKWRGIYPNPAFSRMTYRDALWMVRIITRFTDEHIRALVETAQLENPRYVEHLERSLIERRDRIAREYLTRYVSLDRFQLIRREAGNPAQSLCFEDLAISHAGVDHRQVVYKIRFMAGSDLDKQLGWLQFQPDPDHPAASCILLPIGDRRPHDLAPDGAPDNHPLRYGVMHIDVFRKPSLPPTRIAVHFYDRGPENGYVIVGIERPPNPAAQVRK